jgi:NAD-dependent protein deacetylase/lipoamidase
LTGAGISAESGLKTFRDIDGLWEGYDIEEVASPAGWFRNPQLVLDFYNMRRREIAKAQPNAAHKGLALLENKFEVNIITQNIDDLHERAGSSQVMHLHGEIFKMKSSANGSLVYQVTGDIHLGEVAEDGAQLRPHVVWFGEPVPMIGKAAEIIRYANCFILIGTSLNVYPAAGLMDLLKPDVPKYIVDKKIPMVQHYSNITAIEKPATEGIGELLDYLL